MQLGHKRRVSQGLWMLGLWSLGLSLVGSPVAWAQRPTAPRLFADNTLAYVRIDDTRDMKAKMADSSMGRLGNDPQLKPMLGEIYNSLITNLDGMQERLGVNFEELLSIPNGEMAIAVSPTETFPAVSVLLEAGDEMPAVEILLERLEERLSNAGAEKRTKEVGELTLIGWRDPNRNERQMGYFINQGCLVISSQVDEAEKLAQRWTGNGIDFKPLSDNRRFTTIMSRCVGVEGERPQASFFVDPIAIFKEVIKGNPNGTMALTFLPVLGLDGVQGVGGSLILQTKEFDSVTHLHLLLASPRKNLLDVIRPKSGPTDPEDWVAEDAGSYVTVNWDVKKTLSAVAKIFDNFRGEGAFQDEALNRVSEFLGIDFQKEFLDQLGDRFSLAQFFIRPAKLNSGSNVYCIHLKDGSAFRTDTMPKIFEKLKQMDDRWTTTVVAGETTYAFNVPTGDAQAIRAPEVCMTVAGNMILVADSRAMLERALATRQGQNEILADSVEYKLVRDRIKAQLRDQESSIVSYTRPEESLRLFYDLAADPENKARLKELSESNPIFAALSNGLEKYKLPPFEVIAKYLAPAGSFIVEDETGIHQTSFSMRRE
jgi:hypothetical protein